MNHYFVMKIAPMPENQECKDISEGTAHIWVISDYRDEAKNRAISYVQKYLWQPISVEVERDLLPELIPTLHEDDKLLYQEALLHGIAAHFVAVPKEQGKREDVVEFRRLRLPE